MSHEIQEMLFYNEMAKRIENNKTNTKTYTQEEVEKIFDINEKDLDGWENIELEDMD